MFQRKDRTISAKNSMENRVLIGRKAAIAKNSPDNSLSLNKKSVENRQNKTRILSSKRNKDCRITNDIIKSNYQLELQSVIRLERLATIDNSEKENRTLSVVVLNKNPIPNEIGKKTEQDDITERSSRRLANRGIVKRGIVYKTKDKVQLQEARNVENIAINNKVPSVVLNKISYPEEIEKTSKHDETTDRSSKRLAHRGIVKRNIFPNANNKEKDIISVEKTKSLTKNKGIKSTMNKNILDCSINLDNISIPKNLSADVVEKTRIPIYKQQSSVFKNDLIDIEKPTNIGDIFDFIPSHTQPFEVEPKKKKRIRKPRNNNVATKKEGITRNIAPSSKRKLKVTQRNNNEMLWDPKNWVKEQKHIYTPKIFGELPKKTLPNNNKQAVAKPLNKLWQQLFIDPNNQSTPIKVVAKSAVPAITTVPLDLTPSDISQILAPVETGKISANLKATESITQEKMETPQRVAENRENFASSENEVMLVESQPTPRRQELPAVHVTNIRSDDENHSNAENIDPVDENNDTNMSLERVVKIFDKKKLHRSPLKSLAITVLTNIASKEDDVQMSMNKSVLQLKKAALQLLNDESSVSAQNTLKKSINSSSNTAEPSSASVLLNKSTISGVSHGVDLGMSANQTNFRSSFDRQEEQSSPGSGTNFTLENYFGFDSDIDDENEVTEVSVTSDRNTLKKKLKSLKTLLPQHPKPRPARISKGTVCNVLKSPQKQGNIRTYLNRSMEKTKYTNTTTMISDQTVPSVNDTDEVTVDTENVAPDLFQEKVIPRKSYTRVPKRKKRNFLGISEDEDSEEEVDSDDDAKKRQKKTKIKRPKKADVEKKKELDEFCKEFNSMCEEVDNFEIIIV